MSTENSSLAVLLLAAGKSTRFGDHKLLADCCGKPLIAHVLSALGNFDSKNIYAVTGHNAADVEALLDGINIIRFRQFNQGMGASISFGVTKILKSQPSIRHILILLADQVAIDRENLAAFVAYYREYCDLKNAAQTALWKDALTGGAQTSPPAIFPSRDFDALMRLTGDRGAGDILKRAKAQDRLIEYPFPQAGFDIDTVDDLLRFEALAARHSPRNS